MQLTLLLSAKNIVSHMARDELNWFSVRFVNDFVFGRTSEQCNGSRLVHLNEFLLYCGEVTKGGGMGWGVHVRSDSTECSPRAGPQMNQCAREQDRSWVLSTQREGRCNIPPCRLSVSTSCCCWLSWQPFHQVGCLSVLAKLRFCTWSHRNLVTAVSTLEGVDK
jgi:hypothetical protein